MTLVEKPILGQVGVKPMTPASRAEALTNRAKYNTNDPMHANIRCLHTYCWTLATILVMALSLTALDEMHVCSLFNGLQPQSCNLPSNLKYFYAM